MFGAKLCRGFARHFFENPIELRQRLEPDRERNLADTPTGIPQEITSMLKPSARHIIHKIDAGHLLEFFA